VPNWYQKYRIASENAWPPLGFLIVCSLLLLGVSLWPGSSIHELEHFSGTLLEVRRPPDYPRAHLLVSTVDGQERFMMDGARVGIPAAQTLKVGDHLEPWSRKDGRYQHVWQLTANEHMLLTFDQTARFWKSVRAFAGVTGLTCLGLPLSDS